MPKKISTQEFINRARALHGNTVDYSVTDYITMRQPSNFKCNTHGVTYSQSPWDHLKGKTNGCPKCKKEMSSMVRIKTTEEFILNATHKHGHKYNYNKTKYVTSNTKVTILCPTHGEFDQLPSNHLRGCGCPACGKIRTVESMKLTDDQFIARATRILSNVTFDKVKYVNYNTPVKLCCKTHSYFDIKPDYVLSKGMGCPKCSNINSKRSGVYTDQYFLDHPYKEKMDGWVYLLSLEGPTEHFYKIGITCQSSIIHRVSSFKRNYNVDVVGSWNTELKKAYNIEQHILQSRELYCPLISFHGHTECFQEKYINEVVDYITDTIQQLET